MALNLRQKQTGNWIFSLCCIDLFLLSPHLFFMNLIIWNFIHFCGIAECITRMLNLNQPVNAGGTANEEVYKILIYDRFCQDILSPLIHVKDLRKHGVTLYFLIDKDRKPVHDVPAVYFVQPTHPNVQRIVANASNSLYDSFHLNFSSSIPRPLLEDLASGAPYAFSFHHY